MLLGQDLGGGHQRHLIAILNRNNRRFESDQRLARANVALQQTPHRRGLSHISGDLFQRPLLRYGWMKRQNLLDRRPDTFIQMKGNTGLSLLLAAFEFERKFDEEELFE